MTHAAPTQFRETLTFRDRLALEFAAFARSRGLDRPTVVCSWCRRVMHVGGIGPVSHGLCSRCEAGLEEVHGGALGRGNLEVSMTPTVHQSAAEPCTTPTRILSC